MLLLSMIVGQSDELRPSTASSIGKLQNLEFDRTMREVRVQCDVIGVNAPLEFFCVVAGTSEHESVLRTRARPSDVHTALLAIGMTPGKPLHFDSDAKKWTAPTGPRIDVFIAWNEAGQKVEKPAASVIRNLHTKEALKELYWVFAGSQIMQDGTYGADMTGQLMALVNFELATLDVPEIASSSNESLTLETDLEALPPPGSAVTMILRAR